MKSRTSKAPSEDIAVGALNALRERGILGGSAGLHGNIWKVRPPLVFNREHADMLVAGLDGVLGEMD